MYKITTMYPDIFWSPSKYVNVKTVQTCSWGGNENVIHETYIIVSISFLKSLHLFQRDTFFSIY